MGCLGFILPILGVIGYYYDINWLFYTAGSIATVLDIISIISGELRCFGTIITVVSWVAGYRYTGSLWSGMLLGSCVSTVIMTIGIFVFYFVTMGMGAAIGGFLSLWEKK